MRAAAILTSAALVLGARPALAAEGRSDATELLLLGDREAAQGGLSRAAELYLGAYDRFAAGGAARPGPAELHEALEKGVNAAAAAQRREAARADLLCEADRRILRHAVRLEQWGRLGGEATELLRTARTRLHARLARAALTCPEGAVAAHPGLSLAEVDLTAVAPWGVVIERGSLARATSAVRLPDRRAELLRARGGRWARAGVAAMAAGMMAIGVGIALSTIERHGPDARAALALVVGGTSFVAGFPMLILGDRQRRSAQLGLGPRGLALSF